MSLTNQQLRPIIERMAASTNQGEVALAETLRELVRLRDALTVISPLSPTHDDFFVAAADAMAAERDPSQTAAGIISAQEGVE